MRTISTRILCLIGLLLTVSHLAGQSLAPYSITLLTKPIGNTIVHGTIIGHTDAMIRLETRNGRILEIDKDQVFRICRGLHNVTHDYLTEAQLQRLKQFRRTRTRNYVLEVAGMTATLTVLVLWVLSHMVMDA